MEKIFALFAIFALLATLSFAIGYGVSTFSAHGEEIGGWLLILSAFFTLYLFFDYLVRGDDGADR